jgi:hypothetical protein
VRLPGRKAARAAAHGCLALCSHRRVHEDYQNGPFANYFPYTPLTAPAFERLAALGPRTLATMHGSVFRGDGARALRDVAAILRDVLGRA